MKRLVGSREAETGSMLSAMGGVHVRRFGVKHVARQVKHGWWVTVVWWLLLVVCAVGALGSSLLAFTQWNPVLLLWLLLWVGVPLGVSGWFGNVWKKQQVATARFGDECESLGLYVSEDSYGVEWSLRKPVKAFIQLGSRLDLVESVLGVARKVLKAPKGYVWVPALDEDYGDWVVFECLPDTDERAVRSGDLLLAWSGLTYAAFPVTLGYSQSGELDRVWVRALQSDPDVVASEQRFASVVGGSWAAEWVPDSEVMQFTRVEADDPVFSRRDNRVKVEACVKSAVAHNLSGADVAQLLDVDWVHGSGEPRVVAVGFVGPEIAHPQVREPFVDMLAVNLSFTYPGTQWSQSWAKSDTGAPVLFMSRD